MQHSSKVTERIINCRYPYFKTTIFFLSNIFFQKSVSYGYIILVGTSFCGWQKKVVFFVYLILQICHTSLQYSLTLKSQTSFTYKRRPSPTKTNTKLNNSPAFFRVLISVTLYKLIWSSSKLLVIKCYISYMIQETTLFYFTVT